MRVILKPAGLFIILGAFVALLWFVIMLNSRIQAGGGSGVTGIGIAAAAATSSAATPPSTGVVVNTSFEGEYAPVILYDTKAVLDGVVAQGWKDDSSWASVQVSYAKDESSEAHSGKSCQRIDIKTVERTTDKPSVVQFNQALQLTPGSRYCGGFYLKANKPMEVEVSFRQVDWPYRYYGAKVVNVGTDWTEASVDARITEMPNVYLMIKTWTPGTLWVDDASLQELSEAGTATTSQKP